MMNLEGDFDFYRKIYINNLKKGVFPWKPAYFYYVSSTEDIDVMDFVNFKENIQLESLSANDNVKEVSEPIYQSLEQFYSPVLLFNTENELIRVL